MRWCFLFALLCLFGCDGGTNEGEYKVDSENVVIELGSSVNDLLKSSSVKFSTDCLGAVGMCWYELVRRGQGNPPINLTVVYPGRTVEIQQVIGVSVVVNKVVTSDIENFTVTLCGLPDNSLHEDHKELIYTLIAKLKAAGWKKYYFPSDPRISGSELGKFDGARDVFGVKPLSHPLFDSDYVMSLPEWLAGNGFYDWYMYSGQYIAHVQVQRKNSEANPSKIGMYLITIEFSSLDSFWRTDFDEDVRFKWKELFPEHLRQLLARRNQVEELARFAGVSIDESYQAPRMEKMK